MTESCLYSNFHVPEQHIERYSTRQQVLVPVFLQQYGVHVPNWVPFEQPFAGLLQGLGADGGLGRFPAQLAAPSSSPIAPEKSDNPESAKPITTDDRTVRSRVLI